MELVTVLKIVAVAAVLCFAAGIVVGVLWGRKNSKITEAAVNLGKAVGK